MSGLVVDLFAGGGGASVGIEAALGRSVDIAINHDAVALAVHKANHPATRHLEADIWEVKPREATGGRPVDVLWASPDCTHFSVAKGNVPRKQEIRSLAWAVVRWAKAVRPSVIFLENVQEFRGWGPLGDDGRPVKAQMGLTFKRWKGRLEGLGYQVDYKVLDASHFGAPTRRRRLFMVARCDGKPIRWPAPTHSSAPGLFTKPVRTAAECIDWSLPCPSIFERERPLAEKTMWRIAQGIRRFVLENPRPYILKMRGEAHSSAPEDPMPTITAGGRAGAAAAGHALGLVTPSLVKVNHGKRDARGESIEDPMTTVTAQQRGHALVAPTLIQTGYGERDGQAARVPGLHKPLGTMVDGQKHALVAAFLAKHFGGHMTPGSPLDRPADTITAKDHHALAAATLVQFNHNNVPLNPTKPLSTIASNNHVAEVRAFLTAFYGQDGGKGKGQKLDESTRTLTTKHRLGLVTVEGVDYQIVDIGMRMLQPHELLAAQFGRFAETYDLSAARTKAAKVRLIGNSVCPEVAEAVVAANLPRAAKGKSAA